MLSVIDEILKRDNRYKIHAYSFILASLEVARQITKKPKHVTALELLEGVKVLAQKEFGIMAKTVLECCGIKTTDDIGEIVFNLIEADILSKTEEDKKEDFHNIFNFDEVFIKEYQFSVLPSKDKIIDDK
ncbi:MAG: Minf_1886 family protein [candidate division WOR-3 bacterium]